MFWQAAAEAARIAAEAEAARVAAEQAAAKAAADKAAEEAAIANMKDPIQVYRQHVLTVV